MRSLLRSLLYTRVSVTLVVLTSPIVTAAGAQDQRMIALELLTKPTRPKRGARARLATNV